MKKTFIIGLLAALALTVSCSEDNGGDNTPFDVFSVIPDPLFKEHVQAFDQDKDGVLSQDEADRALGIALGHNPDYEGPKVESLEGIEMFPDIWMLYCQSNNISSLDLSRNRRLEEIHCSNNVLKTLNIGENPRLESLRCAFNELSALDVSSCEALTEILCENNNILALDITDNRALKYLDCHDNNISVLDVGNNSALEQLSCWNNNLYFLDVSRNPELKGLNFNGNNFSADAIREVFAALPMRDAGDDAVVLYGDNPGSAEITEADRKVAEDKNWTVELLMKGV